MTRAISAVAQPVQLHAHGLQIANGRGVLRLATQQAHCRESETLAGRSQRMQMIGVRTAQADQPISALCGGSGQMWKQLEPLVAANQ